MKPEDGELVVLSDGELFVTATIRKIEHGQFEAASPSWCSERPRNDAREMSIEEIAARLLGRCPTRIERVVYDFEGEVEPCGDLQLWFGADLVRLFVATNVEIISWDFVPWRNPFEARSEENVEYLRTHGQPRLVDVTAAARYRDLVGKPILRVFPLANRFGKLAGVTLESEGVALNVYLVDDDLAVTWDDDVPHW